MDNKKEPSNIRRPTDEKVNLNKNRNVQNSGYSQGGASKKKTSVKAFNADSKSAFKDIDENLNTLRKRSRTLYMTSPIATTSIKTNRTNVIGQGLKLKCRINREILGLTQEEADKWEKTTETWFSLWADSKFCDIKRLDNFYELQQIALNSWLLNGDAFALIRRGEEVKGQPFDIRIQLLEADRVVTEGSNGIKNLIKKLDNGNKVLNGVEVNKYGEVVAYWVCSDYPDSTAKKEWTRVEAYGEESGTQNVIHILEGERAEQYRGVPYLAPVIETLKQITRYTDSEVMASVVNAMFSIFVRSEKGDAVETFAGVNNEDEILGNEFKLGVGTINFLEPGEDIVTVDPSRPNVNFDTFVSAMCKQIGAALEIPADLLVKKFDTSYSASRASMLEAWKAFKMRRVWFSNDFCQPIYEAWLTEAITKGYIKAPGYFTNPLVRKAWCTCEWSGPAPGQIDPTKEVKAARERIELGVSTREIETAQLTGGDFDKNVEQLLLEAEKMAEIRRVEGKMKKTNLP